MGVQGTMRNRMEKLVVLPFSMGCVSHASVDVAEQRPRRSKSDFRPASLRNRFEDEDEESAKHPSRFLAIPRPSISRLVKGIKSLSQLFIYEDEMEELGMGMEIGCPTDVKHVTHIGWDGLANTNLISTPDLNSYPTPDLNHFKFPTTVPENDLQPWLN